MRLILGFLALVAGIAALATAISGCPKPAPPVNPPQPMPIIDAAYLCALTESDYDTLVNNLMSAIQDSQAAINVLASRTDRTSFRCVLQDIIKRHSRTCKNKLTGCISFIYCKSHSIPQDRSHLPFINQARGFTF